LSHLAHPPTVERAVDLSHSGETTMLEAVAFSKRPVCISHANPNFFHAIVRNKSDKVLRALAETASWKPSRP
jgi:membrane dipeptidase